MTQVDERPVAETPNAPGPGSKARWTSVKTRNSLFALGAVTITAVILALVLYPLGAMLSRIYFPNGSFNSEAFVSVFGSSSIRKAMLNTVIVVVLSGTFALIIGALFAWLNERTDATLGSIGAILPLVPFLMPPIAMSAGWIFLANARTGTLNVALRAVLEPLGYRSSQGPLTIESWPGLIYVYTIYLVPFVYVVLSSAFRSIDPALEEASRTSGASLLRTIRLVALPTLRPAIFSAAVLAVVFASSVVSIPLLIGTGAKIEVIPVSIVHLMQRFPPATDQAVTLGLLITITVLTAWSLQRRTVNRNRHATIGSGRIGSGARVRLGKWRWVARYAMIIYLLLVSVLPFLALLLVALQPFWSPEIKLSELSFDNFIQLLGSDSIARQSIINSVMLALIGATVGMVVVVILIIYTRERAGRIGSLSDFVTKVPAGIPHIVVGVAFLLAFAAPPFGMYGTPLLLLLAYITVYLPQASVAAGAAYDQVGRSVVEASRVSGADQTRTLLKVQAPLMLPGIIGGWTLLFVLMAGELNTSVILASPNTPVVGFMFLSIWENGTYSQLAALGTVTSVISGVLVSLIVFRSRTSAGVVGSQ
jgi:iron(III) transport system permease protein